MSSYPLVKFVDSPAVAAVVRYDFNDQSATPARKVTDFDPGVPTLEGDPDAVGQSFGFRSLSITHTIKGTKAAAMAALSLVSKELLRRTNWVLFKPSAAQQAVWFKTYRAGYQPVTLDQVYVRVDGGGTVALPDTWKITVPLVAEAFAYGAREVIPTFQVVQGPVDLAGPTRTAMHVVLPTIKGDAPTGLRVTVTPASGADALDAEFLVGCVCGTAAMVDPVVNVGTADIWTPSAGGAVTTGDATYFSGDYRTFALTTTPVAISTILFPLLVRGRYKILVRGEFSGSNVTMLFTPVATVANPTKSLVLGAAAVYQGWVDLGDFTFPPGVTLPEDQSNTTTTQAFQVNMVMASGTGTAKIDAFKAIPVDGPTVTRANLLRARGSGAASWPAATGPSFTNVYDADSEAFWAYTVSGGPTHLVGTAARFSGYFPVADPAAAQNVLMMMVISRGASTAGGPPYMTTTGAQSAVDVSYYPRFLHVGDGT